MTDYSRRRQSLVGVWHETGEWEGTEEPVSHIGFFEATWVDRRRSECLIVSSADSLSHGTKRSVGTAKSLYSYKIVGMSQVNR